MRCIAALGLLLLAAQNDPADLIRRLHSEKIEERDAAASKLIDLGDIVRPRIEELLREPDKEVASRAASILRELDQRKQLSALRAAGRVRTVQLENTPLEEALQKLFDGFGVKSRIEFKVGAPVITTVTLKLKDAGFWEAVDQFCSVANVRHEPEWTHVQCSVLTFSRPLPWPVYSATLGDVRIYATLVVLAGGGEKHGDITARLTAVFPPWVVPKRARIEGLKIAGELLKEDEFYTKLRTNEGNLPLQTDSLTVVAVWRGGDSIKRASLKGAAKVSIEGTIVVVDEDSNGPSEKRTPFAISGLAVPPIPAR